MIEQTPLEEAWKNVLDILGKQISVATVNSWLKPLLIVGFENGTLKKPLPKKCFAMQRG